MMTVKVFTTGGTIASAKDETTGTIKTAKSGKELVGNLRDFSFPCNIEVEEVLFEHSWNVTPVMVYQLAKRIESFLERDDAQGVVVTHGTDTIDETAFYLHRTLDSEIPIVLTGAMHNHSDICFDGYNNLYESICVAASPKAKGHGTLVVFNSEIHSARWVVKTQTSRMNAYSSANTGRIGEVNGLVPTFFYHNSPSGKVPLGNVDFSKIKNLRVEVFFSGLGVTGDLLGCGIDSHVDGIVIEGTGSGNISESMVPAVERAIKNGIPVIVVSRCFEGAAVPMYGNPGGGKTLGDLGVMHGRWLTAAQARIQLILQLASNHTVQQIAEAVQNI